MNNLHPIFQQALAPFTKQYTGTMMSDLNAQVDNALAIYGRPSPDPVALLIDARVHLVDPRPKSRWPEMDEHDMEAYRELGWRLNGIINGTGLCTLELETRGGHDHYTCGKEALTFCAGCGKEICLEHAAKIRMETYCLGCACTVKE